MCKSGSNSSLGFPQSIELAWEAWKNSKIPYQFYGGGKTSVFP